MVYGSASAQQLEDWLDSGIAAHRTGDLERALDTYRRVLAVSPEHGPALNLAGTALLQAGRAAEAVAYLERAARRARNDANVLGNLGHAYLELKRHADAAATFRKASRIAPDAAQFGVGAAIALALDHKLAEAQALLARLCARHPREPLVWLNFGNVLRDQHRFEQAIGAYRSALELDPGMLDARIGIAGALHALRRFDEAESEYRACVAAAPDEPAAHHALVTFYIDRGRYADAERACGEIRRVAPNHFESHLLTGTALAHQRRLLDAVEHYARCAALAPAEPQAACVYGGGLMQIGLTGEGLRWLARAEALDHDSVACQRVIAGALLSEGCFHDAWQAHTYRSGAQALRASHRAWQPGEPLPRDLAGAHVCVLPEQGPGDELFFLRYASGLIARGARVSVRCSPKLVSLLERVLPELVAVQPPEAEFTGADVRILCGDLPLALVDAPQAPLELPRDVAESSRRDFAYHVGVFWPAPAPSLRIDPLAQRVAHVGTALAALGPPPYIGLTWRAGVAPEEQTGYSVLYKAIPHELIGRAVRDLPGTLLALQRKPAPGEIDALAAACGRAVHDFTAFNDDLESMLALLSVIDDYVGVSNTNVHLSAAAGRTARVLVPAPPEWRWMRRRRHSPWFPGFPIYRQSLQGDWAQALAELRQDLARGQA
ncbi:MAG TPA: tetratricopeptide repeat protein [Burkholderiales bacterium]|nr:tetratricopeptide repeat protein [Burkholderiales bacterium]